MKMPYKYTIVKRLIFSGRPFAALWVCYRVLKARLLGGNYRHIYDLAVSDAIDLCKNHMHDYQIDHFNSWAELDTPDRNELIQYQGRDLEGIQELFDKGGCLWLGRLRGKITNLGWSRWGNRVNVWFFPLSPKWVVISHAETLAVHRGRGLYVIFLSHIINELSKQGAEGFIIDCNDWNLPSVRGIEKVGFRLLGYGVHRWHKHLSYYQRSRPDFSSF